MQKRFGQRAEAGADFQDFFARPGLRGGHDAADLVLVVQKILAERFGQFQLALGEDFADVGSVSCGGQGFQGLREGARGGGELGAGDRQGRGEADDV